MDTKRAEGRIVGRRILGKTLAFCRLHNQDEQLVFKQKNLSANSRFPSKTELLVGKLLHAEAITDENGELVVSTWRILPDTTSTIAVEGNEEQQKLCRNWTLGKECAKHCEFRHHFNSPEELEITQRIAETREQNKKRDLKLMEEYHRSDPFQNKAFKALRADLFVNWIIETFGKEKLQKGTGVIDIAGGAGKIADCFIKHGITCTVIDPKIRRKQKFQSERGDLGYRQITECFSYEFLKNPLHLNLIENSSLMIGLHADQPTVDIVKIALDFNKPFAVVPCCVFTNLFPDRRLPSGQPVVTTEHLCQYIQSFHPQIQCGFLNFKGRNKVCYFV